MQCDCEILYMRDRVSVWYSGNVKCMIIVTRMSIPGYLYNSDDHLLLEDGWIIPSCNIATLKFLVSNLKLS